MNAESKEPGNRPRLIWLILVDLLAAYAPWLLFLAVLSIWSILRPSQMSFPDRWWVVSVAPIHSPFMLLLGVEPTDPFPPEFPVMCVVFLAHFVVVVFLHRRFYRWLKYLVPAHLFAVSAIPVGGILWEWLPFL